MNAINPRDMQPQPLRWSDERSSMAARQQWHDEVVADSEVKMTARAIAGYLLHRFNSLTGEAFPSQETIAHDLSRSVRTIKRGVRNLVRQGWLMIRKVRGLNHYYPSRRPLHAEQQQDRRAMLREKRAEDRTWGQIWPQLRDTDGTNVGTFVSPKSWKLIKVALSDDLTIERMVQ